MTKEIDYPEQSQGDVDTGWMKHPDVEVSTGEWAQVVNGETIGTYGLGPCMGLVLYDRETRAGFLAHTMGPEIATFREMLDGVTATNIKSDGLQAWLSGGSGSLSQGYRGDVAQLLNDAGVIEGNISEKWIDGDDEVVDMFLNCDTGECVVEVANHELGYF